jgi:hypothetical protein
MIGCNEIQIDTSRILVGKPLENGHLQDQEEAGRITIIRWILRETVRMRMERYGSGSSLVGFGTSRLYY